MECKRKDTHSPSTGYTQDGCRCPECTEAHSAISRKHYQGAGGERARSNVRANRIEKQQYLLEFKSGGCAACGYNEHPECLDIHHTDPSRKTRTGTRLAMLGWARMVEELESCMVLCANCHRLHHAGVIQWEQT